MKQALAELAAVHGGDVADWEGLANDIANALPVHDPVTVLQVLKMIALSPHRRVLVD